MSDEKRQDDAYNLRRILEEMELDLVRSLRRNMKRHEKEEDEEGFRWEMWQKAKLRNLRMYRKENKKIVDKISPEVERIVNEALEYNYHRGQNLFNRIWDRIKATFSKRKRVKFPKSIAHHKLSTSPPVEQNFFGVNKNKIEVMQEEAEKAKPQKEEKQELQKEVPAVEKSEELQEPPKEQKTESSDKKAKGQEPQETSEPFHPDGKEKPLPEATQDKKLDNMSEQVVNDLKEAQKAVWRRMDDIYRRTIYRAGMNMAAGAKTLDQAVDTATKEFLAAGIDCIEYRNGRRVNIASYAEMALRTASQRAVLLGEGKKRDEWGIYTVVVSAHANTCPLCAPWQGKVLVDDVFCHGTADEAKELGYPLLSAAIKAGLLHPNCRHTISTYFQGITSLPEVPDPKKAAKTYEAEQKQRTLERKIRKWKRIAEGSMRPEEVSLANDKVKQYQDELKLHLDANKELRRDYSREKTRGITEQLKGVVNESRADKLFYVVPPAKGDAIKPHSIYKALNKSPIGRETLDYIEKNNVNIEITYSEESGEGLRGRTFGNHIEIYARNTRTIKDTTKALVHETAHMRYNIGGDQWSEVICMLKELEHEKGLLTEEDKRTTIKVVKRLYPDLPWRER